MESGTISDFIQQLQGQSQIVSMFVFFGVMLIIVTALIIFLRLRRIIVGNKKPATQSISNPFSGLFQTQSTSTQAASTSPDMPDLDMLLSTAPEPAAPPVMPAPTPASQAPATSQPEVVNIRLSNGRVAEAAQMLTLFRDRHTDNLIVQIGNQAYDGTETSVDPDFRRRFIKLMRELSDVAQEISKKKKAASPEPSFLESSDFETTASAATSSPPPEATAPPEESETEATDSSLAAQIEAFLQRKLLLSPQLSARQIHVHSAADGGVHIEVDGQFYPSVGDVADPEIRAYLQQTIAEWQASQQ